MHAPSFPVSAVESRRQAWARFLACCFVAICGVRWFLVDRFASSIAWGDDLDGIARRILRAWENGTLTWSALVATHNGDHRIFATRAWEILWYVLNGSWDPKLVMMTKVPIFAAAATIFIHVLAGRLERRRFVLGGLLAVLFAFPFAFANMIWAFQSQFDFFLLAAALGWWALLEGRVVAAIASATSAILMLGAAPVIAASYLPFIAVAWLTRQWPFRKAALAGAATIGVLLLGLASPTPDRMPHEGTPAEKAAMFLRICAWPHSNLLSIIERFPETARYVPAPLLRYPNPERSWVAMAAEQLDRHPSIVVACNTVGAVLVLSPMLVLLIAVLRRRLPLNEAVGPLALAVFAGLMIAATAVARAHQVTIAPRFLDHVSLAGFASLAAAFLLLARAPRARWLMGWAAFMAAGYAATMVITLAQLSRRAPEASLQILQRYYATTPHDHSALLEGEAFRRFIVSDDPTQFMSELDEPGMERVLPRAVIAPGAPLGRPAAIASVVGKGGLGVALLAAIAAIAIARRSRRAEEARRALRPGWGYAVDAG